MNNPPAFPQFGCSEHNDFGMTLRDYIAVAALQGMIAIGYPEPELRAKAAFEEADRMLKERCKMKAIK